MMNQYRCCICVGDGICRRMNSESQSVPDVVVRLLTVLLLVVFTVDILVDVGKVVVGELCNVLLVIGCIS